MIKNDQKLSKNDQKMIKNDQKLQSRETHVIFKNLKIKFFWFQNHWTWSKMIKNDQKNDQKWSKMIKNDQKNE